MYFLVIETSCDDTSIAVFENFNLLSLKTKSQNIHEKFGGVVPELASREHTNDIDSLITLALDESKLSLDKLNAIVVTGGPGLINSLQIGIVVAKTLASIYQIPIFVINHLEGHIFSPFVNWDPKNIPEQATVLIISGGHTILINKNKFDYKVISQTRDDAIGESFDKVARILELGFPGGKKIDENFNIFDSQNRDFPQIKIPLLDSYDFSYSGIKSKVLQLNREKKYDKESIAYSFMKASIEQLSTKTLAYLKTIENKNLFIVGGVSANSLVRKIFENHNLKIFLPELKYTTDNAAMIGVAFYYRYINNEILPSDLNFDANPKWKIENI